MPELNLSPSVVAQYKEFLMHPEKFENCDYKPLEECFVPADEYTPQHILYNQYVEYLQKPLPKVIFYIIMQEVYPTLYGKNDAATGLSTDLGYKLKFIANT